jgi:AAA domain
VVLKRHRQGEPSQRLTRETVVEPLSYRVNPFVHERKSAILFADGGTGKSTLALLCAMLVSVGGSVAGISAVRGKALYLDYEDDADTHARRLHAIQAGHPDLLDAVIDYQRCTESLPKMVHTLLRKIQTDGITFLVVDSLVAAAGGSAELEAIGKLFAALRILNVTTLIIGHVPKPQSGDDSTKSTVYGSVFSQNYCRMLWEVRKDQQAGEDTSILALTNPKSNHARIHLPFGLTVTQNRENTSIRYDAFDLSQSAVMEAVLPLKNRIRNLLEDGLPRSSHAIAEALGANVASVKATLSKHRGTKWHMIGENHEAQWTVLNH